VELKRRSKDGKSLKETTKADMLASCDRVFGEWKRRSLVSLTRPIRMCSHAHCSTAEAVEKGLEWIADDSAVYAVLELPTA
jgi:hypothetical protein